MPWQEETVKRHQREKRLSFFEGFLVGVGLTAFAVLYFIKAEPDASGSPFLQNCYPTSTAHNAGGDILYVTVCRGPTT